MANFAAALPVIMAHEGGWQNDPTDPGGETNFGLSTNGIIKSHGLTAKDLELDPAEWGKPGYLKKLKPEVAGRTYARLYWLPAYEQITDQVSATKICDAAINMGWVAAHECAQRALGGVQVDSVLGPESIGALNGIRPTDFLAAFSEQLARHYVGCLVARPEMIPTWERVWLKRAGWGLPAEQAGALVQKWTGAATAQFAARKR